MARVAQLQSLLSLPLLLVGFGLPGPVQCWISFRSAKKEQSDLELEMMDTEWLARDQVQKNM